MGGKLMFTKNELETILYTLESYIQGTDDDKLADELVDICGKIEEELVPLSITPIECYIDDEQVDCETFRERTYLYGQMEHDSEGC